MRRRAFSLVELLVALVLLTVGLAACVRAATTIARVEGDARGRRWVADILRARLDTLGATPCGAPRNGSQGHDGITETWQASSDGRRWQVSLRAGAIGRPALTRTWVASVRCGR